MSDLKVNITPEQFHEEQLLIRARDGDLNATRELFELCRPNVTRFLATKAPPEEVDDLVQETMVAGWSGLGRFQGKSALTTWLAGIARNLFYNRVRSQTRKVDSVSLDALESKGGVQREKENEPLENRIVEATTKDIYYSSVERACTLPQQRVLLLAFQGEELDDIGTILNMTPATVRSHFRRGRCKLVSYLIDRHSDFFGGQPAINIAWEMAVQSIDEAKRPSPEEQTAWESRTAGASAWCGAILKLARHLNLLTLVASIWFGVRR